MGHQESTQPLSPQEKKYRELMHNGDDFLKIDIYRSALKKYREAAAMNIDKGEAADKVAECEKLIAKENKSIYIILAVAMVVAALVCIL